MRIGELARQSGVPATALRYYEHLGLLPEPGRTESGYRVYGEEAVDRLAFIRAAQAVGLTLAEVRQVLGVRDAGEAPCRVVIDLIDHRHVEVKARIAELRRSTLLICTSNRERSTTWPERCASQACRAPSAAIAPIAPHWSNAAVPPSFSGSRPASPWLNISPPIA